MQSSTKFCVLVGFVAFAVACADGEDKFVLGSANNTNNSNNSNNENNDNNANNPNMTNNTNSFVPEVEEEYEFSAPAVVGDRVFVANETLNSVAVIDSNTLGIETIPVGFRPTEIAGPLADTIVLGSANVWVLNEGSHTVSRIDSETLKTETFRSLRFGNTIRTSGDSQWAFVWFDVDRIGDDEVVPPQVDLASVTAISADGQHQLATGFNVRDIRFSNDNRYALIFTDDGISRLDLSTIDGDGIVVPIAILDADPDDLEIVVDPDSRFAIGRADTFQGLVLLDLETGLTTRLDLPEIPTDIDWIAGGRLLVSMPRSGLHFAATIPEGFTNLAETIVIPVDDMGNGSEDMGSDMADAGADTGDAGLDGGLDAGDMGAGPIVVDPLPIVVGIEPITLEVDRLGAAEVADSGSVALFFSTLNDEKRAVLVDLSDYSTERLTFEKGLLGAVSAANGDTFVVFHSKQEGEIPQGATPIDPVYIDRSWAISLVDVESAASRLILTPHKVGQSALWIDETFVKLYLGFRIPDDEALREETMKQIVIANLRTFATDTLQLASFPEGFGTIALARRVFVSQIHEQGRLTFLDVDTDERQTVTGYQLNAGID